MGRSGYPDFLRGCQWRRRPKSSRTDLTVYGFSDTEIGRLLQARGHRFAKTNSRHVTGSMNDHIWHGQQYFAQEGGVRVADIVTVNRLLNDTPIGALAPGQHMDFPVKVLTRIIRPSGVA